MVPTLARIALIATLLGAPLAVAVGAAPSPTASDPEIGLSLTETRCDQRAEVVMILRRDFGEVPSLGALTPAGLTMELWTSDRTGSWTMLHHGRDGISCIVTTGFGWTPGDDAAVLLDQALAESVSAS